MTWSVWGGRGIVPASKQTVVLGVLKEEIRACNSCCETGGPRGRGLWPGLEEASGSGAPGA